MSKSNVGDTPFVWARKSVSTLQEICTILAAAIQTGVKGKMHVRIYNTTWAHENENHQAICFFKIGRRAGTRPAKCSPILEICSCWISSWHVPNDLEDNCCQIRTLFKKAKSYGKLLAWKQTWGQGGRKLAWQLKKMKTKPKVGGSLGESSPREVSLYIIDSINYLCRL